MKNLTVSENSGITKVGDKIQRVDAAEKVLGTGEYPDDIYLDGMIYGSAVRARIIRVQKRWRSMPKKQSAGRCDRRIYRG